MLKFLKWTCLICLEIIGIAGIPDDIIRWNSIVGSILEFIDQSWKLRAVLVLSGIAAVFCKSWSPWVFRSRNEAERLRKLAAGLLADSENNQFIRELSVLSYVLQSQTSAHRFI